jgi:asparagine N-glycosylation enzyme membrane subunit Stt3
MPAILGALFPIAAFFLARRLSGDAAGFFAALWMAVGSGAFLWLTHLGLADHHVAEGGFAFLVLLWMFLAMDTGERRYARLAGIALGLFLATRPAGIFIPAILAVTVVLEPSAASMVLPATVAAALIFLPAAGVLWSEYTWLSLAATATIAAGSLLFDSLARKRGWGSTIRYAAMAAAAVVALAAIRVLRPPLLGSLWFEIRRMAGFTTASRIVRTVQELQPVYSAAGKAGWPSVFHMLGVVWVVALPAFVWLVASRHHPARPAISMLALWATVAAIGTIVQVRMAIYLLPIAAVLGGVTCGWLARIGPPVRRRILTAVLVLAVIAGNLSPALTGMSHDGGVPPEWRQALVWLRQNSPEPMSDPDAWTRDYRRGAPGGLWGVAVWWDFGYWVEEIAHRIPMSNGTQSGVIDMARLYTDTIPESAVGWLRAAGARYVVVDAGATLIPGANRFSTQIQLLGRNLDSYLQILVEREGAAGRVARVYLPTYYRSMAARLYLADGQAVKGTGPWIFETTPGHGPGGRPVELVVAPHHFDSETAAAAYLLRHPSDRLTYGCIDPKVSCIDLPAVSGLKWVFSSAKGAVKIFQVE